MAATQPRQITRPSYHRAGKNLGGTDIGANLILKQGSAVDEVAIATAVTDTLVGVSVEKIVAGKAASYQMGGKQAVKAGAAVAVGALLTTDSQGRAITASQSASSLQNLIGKAVTAASAADELIEVELFNVVTAFIGSSQVADRTALAAIAAADRYDGQLVVVQSDNSLWRFESSSSASDTTQSFVVTPGAGSGRWLRADKFVDIKVAVDFNTADAAVLFTVPVGFRLRVVRPWWEVTADFTGGSSSTIGMSSSQSPYNTKGDVQGGAAGDALAALTAGYRGGTLGTDLGTQGLMVLDAGSTVRFDRITSAFTAGTGFAHVGFEVMA